MMQYQDKALRHLYKTERNYHIFKSALIIIATIFVGGMLAYQTNRIVINTNNNTERTQRYIRCIILLPISSYQGSIEDRTKAIDNCSLTTKIPDKVK